MYIKNIMLLILFSLFTNSIIAQNQLTGKVINKVTNTPINGAIVYIEDLKTGASSDSNGNYSIKNLPEGTYAVEVHYLGFQAKALPVKIKGITTTDFSLNVAEYEENEVVVTGSSMAIDMNDLPQSITSVPNSYLMQNASTNIIDAISKIPGVSGITDGQSISKPVIRGLGYNRVVTVNDGVRQEGQQWGDEFGIEIDPNSVDRVEILKGPASLIYGSDAMSGVINFLPEKTLPEGEIKGDILLNYQTNNGLYNAVAHIAGTKKGIIFSGRFDNTMAHAYQNKNDGYVLNSQFSNINGDATVGLHKKWGFSQLHYSYFELKTGIVEGARDSTGAQQRQTGVDSTGMPIYTTATASELKSYTPFLIHQDVKHQKLVWDNSFSLGEGRLIARLAWQQNSRQENNDPSIPNISNIWYFLNSYNYDFHYVSGTKNDFDYSAGINGKYQNSKNKGTLLLIPEYDLFDLGAFAIANKKIGKLNISGGIRYDIHKFNGHDDYVDINGNQLASNDPNAIHQFTAYNSDFTGISGSLGAVYHVNDNIYIKANLARGFRAPNVAESGSNGIHDGTVVYEIGEPSLKPEQSLEFDFTPGIKTKDFSAELSIFYNSISNFIYSKQLLSTTDSTKGQDSLNSSNPGFPDAPVFKYSQADAVLMGCEAVLDIHPSGLKWFDWYTAFSTVDAHLLNVPDSTRYLPFTPPARLRSEITLSIKKLNKVFNNSYLRIGMLYSFQQANIYNASSIYMGLADPNELKAATSPTAAYMLINAGLGSDIYAHGHKAFSVYISIDNLLDNAYMDYMSRFKYYPTNYGNGVNRVGVYNMGRNVSFKLLVPLYFKKAKID